MLALVVELLVTALIGANFGFEASSFFVDAGNRPRIGQAFIVIDPGALAGRERFLDRSRCWCARCSSTTACGCPARAAKRCGWLPKRDGLEVRRRDAGEPAQRSDNDIRINALQHVAQTRQHAAPNRRLIECNDAN